MARHLHFSDISEENTALQNTVDDDCPENRRFEFLEVRLKMNQNV